LEFACWSLRSLGWDLEEEKMKKINRIIYIHLNCLGILVEMVIDVGTCSEFVGNVLDDIMPTSSNDYEGTITDIMPNDYELISTYLDIRAFCHVNLMDAKIRIIHDDHSGLVFNL
jgi:hypothetical protein